MSKKTYAIKLNNVESCAEALDKRIKGGIAVLGMGDEEEVRRELEAVLEGLEGVVKLEEDEKEEWKLFDPVRGKPRPKGRGRIARTA